jgi:hypothetical protein
MKDVPANSHIQFDGHSITPFSGQLAARQNYSPWVFQQITTYVELRRMRHQKWKS